MARACCKLLQQALLYVSQAADLPQENVVTYADTPSTCHCEERSDGTIRIPAEVHNTIVVLQAKW